MHNCIICNNKTEHYFDKNFNTKYLGKVEYFRCPNCGFVHSDTHYSMNQSKWEDLNKFYNMESYDIEREFFEHKPPYLQQALFFQILEKNNIIKKGNWLDYGAGLGNFNNILKKYFNLQIDNYDKYFNPKLDIKPRSYDLVFSSAVLEHITSFKPLEEMLTGLKSDAAFAFHTVVCERIPKDSNWFYLLPFHCSFFTNRSMQIFMDNYGFDFSIYSPIAKTWVLLKGDYEEMEEKSKAINKYLMSNYLYVKNGFVDYWKGF